MELPGENCRFHGRSGNIPAHQGASVMSIQFNASRFVAVVAVIAALIPLQLHAGVTGNVSANGFTLINFDPTVSGTSTGSNVNGISNKGHVVGFTINANGTFSNFTGTPARTTLLNTGAGAMAFGINSTGAVVGSQNGLAFLMPKNGAPQALPLPSGGTSATAFGINDKGSIVGQFTSATGTTPGFFLRSMKSAVVTINAPA